MRSITLLLTFLLLGTVAPAAHAAVRGDFDGDGHDDLAVGAPDDSVVGRDEAGAVNILYGTGKGLSARADQQFTMASAGVAGVPSNGAHFGAALAAGDFDHDGRDDLAIGAPGAAGGSVTLLYGSPSGLRPRAPTLWSQGRGGVPGRAEDGDRFGAALAVGRLNGDRYDDLAVGVPSEGVGGVKEAGAVNILYGGANGLRAAHSQLWTQDTRGVKGIPARQGHFGAALAAGDVSRNGRGDLAIGIPGARISGHDAAGAVTVLYGRSSGLTSADDLWSQDARGVLGTAQANDRFGSAVAIGDFDGDGDGDLAIGSPIDTVGNALGAGAVNVLNGSRGGLTAAGDQLWSRASAGVPGRASIGETFGSALVAADVSGNHVPDLAIGVPGQEVAGHPGAGGVTVLYGRRGHGLGTDDAQDWTQATRGVPGAPADDDGFGRALGAGDFDGDGRTDLAIGAPGDSSAGVVGAGAAVVLPGSDRGVRTAGAQLWTQGSSGVLGAVGRDAFASALSGG